MHTLLRLAPFSLFFIGSIVSAADVFWASNTSGFWDDAVNWSSNPNLPSALDDITIDSPIVGTTIWHNTGSTTIQGLDLSDRLVVQNNSQLSVTGEALLQPGSRLSVEQGAIFSSDSVPTLDGVDLDVISTGLATGLSFPSITAITNQPNSTMSWSASGSSASLDLSQVATLTHSTSSFQNVIVSATLGGQIDLGGLVRVIPGGSFVALQVTASGTGSTVDISNLTGLDQGALGMLTVSDGGSVAWPNPVNVSGLDLELGSPLTTGQITSFVDGKITSTSPTAPDLLNVANADGSTLEAGSFFDLGILSLPSLINYTNSSGSTQSFLAEGAGSELDLSSTVSLTGSSSSFASLNVAAIRGGQVDLSNVSTISRPNDLTEVTFESSGVGSHIDLSGYSSYTAGAITEIRVVEDASMDWSNPTQGDGIDLDVGGTLTTSQIESWTNGEVRATNAERPAPDFANLSNADGSSLAAGSVVFSTGNLYLPGLVHYQHTRDRAVSFTAVESGSTLDLSALESITMSSADFRNITIQSQRGGSIDLSGLTSVSKLNLNTSITASATGDGSMIDISALQGYEDSPLDELRVERLSTVLWSNPTSISNLSLRVGGTLATSQIVSFTSGTLQAINAGGTAPDFSSLSNADGSNLLAGDGIVEGDLVLPQLAAFENTGDRFITLRASRNSVLDLSGMTALRGTTSLFGSTLLESNDGQVILTAATLTIENNVKIQLTRNGVISVGTMEIRDSSILTGEGSIQGNVDLNGGSLESGDVFSTGMLEVAGLLTARNGGLALVRENTTLLSPTVIRIESGGQLAGGGLVDGVVDIDIGGMLAADDIEFALNISGALNLASGAELSVTEFYEQDRASLSGEFLLVEAMGGITGTFDTPPDVGVDSHLDNGYFLDSIMQTSNTVSIEIYSALPGDANGDKVVDVSDFNIWNANKFTFGGDWTNGDFNDDGFVDVSDFNVWNANKFTAFVPDPEPVPEPSAWILLFASLLLIGQFRKFSATNR